mgnify:CR=1 FL=1
MSEILSKQQLKSKETKAKIFRAAKHILQKHGYEALSIKNICEEAGVSNGSFIIILRLKMICFPTILKSSRILTQIFLIYQRVLMKLNLPLYMSTWIMCIIARNSALNLWRIIILRKTSLWTHWSVPTSVPDRDCTQLSAEMYRCRNHFPESGYWGYHDRYSYDRYWKCFRMVPERGERRFWGKYETFLESYMNGVF